MLLTDFVNELNGRIEREKDALASGSPKSYEDYVRKVGLITGMRQAIAVLYEMVEKLPKEERGL